MSYDLNAIRRYTLASYARAQFVNQLGILLANDPFWTVISLTTTNGVTGATHGVIKLTNKADTNMEFLVGLDWSVNYGAALRFGLKKQGATPSLDCYTESGKSSQYDMALQLQNPGTPAKHMAAGALSRMDVITQKECIFVMTTPITYNDTDVPVRLYLGRCKAFEVEDNSYGREFYGVFGHVPLGVADAASLEFSNATGYVVSRGVVKKNRSNQLYGEYDFVGSSQALSPGPGGRMIMSPFLLGNAQEGVRGTFWDVNTAVLRSTQFFPDGSVIDIDGARYYVLHCNIEAGSWWPQSAIATHTVVQYGYNFFDSVAVPFGTRVMLFKI
ncbi:hypothetical protein [Paenibacillus sp. P46E]|uniref:hypothetical protein n=1 Tax=Paenibacillus sp. P46E TaxID=1349436 RepID=UPI00093D0F69|nr:hypothetical protein [Paenibacillus sp. P46E]OKP97869.1 hypothetical protein A3849_13235 [Paenibacillus sp. P46E]